MSSQTPPPSLGLPDSTTDLLKSSWRRSYSAPVPPAMDRDTQIAAPGPLRNPEELGRADAAPVAASTSVCQKIAVHPNVAQSRLCVQRAMERSRHMEAQLEYDTVAEGKTESAVFGTLCYQGMEVLVCVSPQKQHVYLVCPRSHLVLQSLSNATCNGEENDNQNDVNFPVLEVCCHSVTGNIYVRHANHIDMFVPSRTDPTEHCFGRYRWNFASQLDTRTVFGTTDRRPALSASGDGKLLVTCGTQMGVWDATDCLWMTALPNPIVHASISGDGRSIAVVLEDTDSDTNGCDGVHTFERDQNDGSQRPTLQRQYSVGILYKPGPFLVHSAPVSSVQFRGYGHVTSSAVPGNDLLLTTCEDSTARLFGQNNWKMMTEWTTPPRTRVDWVEGVSAFTLGDLETSKKPASKKNSESIHQSIGKRLQFSHASSHPAAPTTNAGAWISELTVSKRQSVLRLSRLTYLKRGVDEMNPTLLEMVSAVLPAHSVFGDRVLEHANSLSITGLWPAWNPWLSESTDLNTTEPLPGSAMSVLGLMSGPSVRGGGFFGGETTQTPPTELRLACSHAVAGNVTLLDLTIMGDKTLTALEMGHPVRSVLSLSHLDDALDVFGGCKRRRPLQASVDYNSTSVLVAEAGVDQTVDIIWRRPGTISMLPYQWTSEDVDPVTTAAMLESSHSRLKDESLIPIPLRVMSLHVPEPVLERDNLLRVLLWWRAADYDGCPLLVVISDTGTIIVFELPPPWSTLEPPMPEFVKQEPGSMSFDMNGISPSASGTFDTDDDNDENSGEEYEISITPDPEYGLGLRLESQPDGLCAIAGSYKRHPVTGEALPAEKTGVVSLGDQLLTANDVDLDEKPFDDIVDVLRELSSASGPGKPIKIRFRTASKFDKKESFVSNEGPRTHRRTGSQASEISKRRTVENIIGVSLDDVGRGRGSSRSVRSGTQTSATERDTRRQQPSHIVGLFEHQLDLEGCIDAEACCALMPVSVDDLTTGDGSRTSLLFFPDRDALSVGLVSISPNSKREESQFKLLGRANGTGNDAKIQSLRVIEKEKDSFIVFIILSDDTVALVSLSVSFRQQLNETTIKFQHCPVLQLPRPWRSDCVLRAQSAKIFATLQPDDSVTNPIQVWSWSAHPGTQFNGGSDETKNVQDVENYFRSEISPTKCLSSERFTEFSFVTSGYLDNSPLICAFSEKGAFLLHKSSDSTDWLPAVSILYSTCPWPDSRFSSRSILKEGPFFVSPSNVFPHLKRSLCITYASSDEAEKLNSDWHPDVIIAQICTDKRGVKVALLSRVRKLLRWLSVEGKELSDGHLETSLMVAPHYIVKSDEMEIEETATTAQSLMSTLPRPNINSNAQVKKLQATLLDSSTRSSRSLPPVLRSMRSKDLCVLWALIEIALNPPDFAKYDLPAQLFLFSLELFEKVRSVSSDATKKETRRSMPRSNVIRVSPKLENKGDVDFLTIASNGALGAMLTANQKELVDSFCRPGQKLTWASVREKRVAFWCHSDSKLSEVSEKIGQSMFMESRDIMECALFFIVAKKFTALRNFAATDRSDSGRTFSKFISDFDFTSERGRRAAEKNAFSLLRKCKYRIAAAFFLLADPPFLTAAVETIATKLNDLDLAFLVARLMESPDRDSWESSRGRAGILGGGGGYATFSNEDDVSRGGGGTSFSNWKPKLGKEARRFLVDRVLPAVIDDKGITAVSLIWAGKRPEAAWYLAGAVKASLLLRSMIFDKVDDVPTQILSIIHLASHKDSRRGLGLGQTLRKANLLVDLSSTPMILDCMKASHRTRMAAAIQVADALVACGAEMSAMRSIVDFAKEPNAEDKENVSRDTSSGQHSADHGTGAQSHFASQQATSSSIFDAFDPAPSMTKPQSQQAMPSSIFNTFDAAPMPVRANPQSAVSNDVQSSIFDDFTGPPEATKTSDSVPQSSVFDDFDVPPKKQLQPEPPTGAMQSSIFDDFDVPAARAPATVPLQKPSSEKKEQAVNNSTKPDDDETDIFDTIALSIKSKPAPSLWTEWRDAALLNAVSRRLLREVASVLSDFYGDPTEMPLDVFFQCASCLVSSGVSDVLQSSCNADALLDKVKDVLDSLCTMDDLDGTAVVRNSIRLLGAHSGGRLFFSVVLYVAIDRHDMAEYLVRSASESLIQMCSSLQLSQDELVHKTRTRSFVASQIMRREAARLSWQLESCLWLHRGGGFPLSGESLNQSTVAARTGLLLASWNRNFECLEAMIQNAPDMAGDEEAGRYLWSSVKLVDPKDNGVRKKTNSGGWEFLVECKRAQATELLRERPTGCFIIRPHPEDTGVFTLSFKTNLVPTEQSDESSQTRDSKSPETSGDELSDIESSDKPHRAKQKGVRKDDVVQHAIVRLSDSGFRCGSFGPFTTLISLLEAVSSSLPFKLRFDLPPRNRVIREDGSQTSPNAVLLRKLNLRNARSIIANPPGHRSGSTNETEKRLSTIQEPSISDHADSFGVFLQLKVLSLLRSQLCAVAMVGYDDSSAESNDANPLSEDDSSAEVVDSEDDLRERQLAEALRMLSPMLQWCRTLEVGTVQRLAPLGVDFGENAVVEESTSSESVTESPDAIEVAQVEEKTVDTSGDAILRGMIQQGSGVEFSTLRLIDGGECTMLVLFSRTEAMRWLIAEGIEETAEGASFRLEKMEYERVIESISLSKLPLKNKSVDLPDEGVRYRFVDPWEVEALNSREGETRSAFLGRSSYVGFSLGQVALATESMIRSIGGVPLLELWSSAKCGIALTKSLATVNPPWERCASGDLQLMNGTIIEPPPFINSIRQSLYRNALYRRLKLPQRFMALVQVELLDLKNLTTPGGSLSLTAYALLRLKRAGSGGMLTNKARTLDCASTQPVKLQKTSGPNAPASWGSVVRFRFPLPEDVNIDGTSYDRDRESIFKGPPMVLQVTAYEKKLLADHSLGTADVTTDGLGSGGQLEEWVPLRSDSRSISWFARIRLTLRFELMCQAPEGTAISELVPSVGLQRIEELCHSGGSAQEDLQKRSLSSPDLMTYFSELL